MRFKYLLTAAATAAALAVSPSHAADSTYPTKPIRLVIGSAPGSGPDIISRTLAERLYKSWGQRIVVDSRPGVAGIISAELVLQAEPDGYTWMMLTSQLMVATSVFKNVKFDLDNDFDSVSLIGTVPFVMVVNPEVPAKSIQDVIALAKKSPGSLRYGSAGAGASEHLSGVMFTELTGTKMLHVPYKGIAQAIADTISKEVHLAYPVLPAALPHVKSGRVRALGVTSPKRNGLLPDVPSISEVVPGYSMLGWYSIVVPKRTPKHITAKVSAEVQKAVSEPAFNKRLQLLGVDTVGSNQAEFDQFRRDQRKLLSNLVKASNVDIK